MTDVESTGGPLHGAVVAVAGAGGPAGSAALRALAAAGASVVGCDADAERLGAAVAAARAAHPQASVSGEVVDLLDLDATRDWAARIEDEHGRVDGLVHLVGGWRGSKNFAQTDLADWELLHKLLIRTVQHTSLAFEGALERSGGNGRFVLVSAAGSAKPTGGNAAYGAAKAAAEAWTLALGSAFKKAGGEAGPQAAAVILVVKALVNDAMRAANPEGKFPGFTDVEDLAVSITGLWSRPVAELNGTRQWLTPEQ
ncbi:SDR family NAD(P)-dependent oxidoreductase [Streptomyces polyrhachis]|uniref:SDR family NAD(P)-dependent oxidoreductase n=1 Tax=Streptomyces polyrhachis TaxID=1282885 RepID=A0ABW2GAR9_9ACTN